MVAFLQDFQTHIEECSIRGADLYYQILRLRVGRYLPDAEVHLIMDYLANTVQTYEQVVEASPLYLSILMGVRTVSNNDHNCTFSFLRNSLYKAVDYFRLHLVSFIHFLPFAIAPSISSLQSGLTR